MVLKNIYLLIFILLFICRSSTNAQSLKGVVFAKQYTEKEVKKAEEDLKKNSSNSEATTLLARHYWRNADTLLFRQNAEILLYRQKQFVPDILENLSLYYFSKQKYEDVVALLNIYKDKPISIDAYFIKGKASIFLKLFEDADVLFEAINSMAPEWVDAYIEKGKVRLIREMFDEAKIAFEKAIELNPNVAEAYYGIAICMIRQGDHTLVPCDYMKKAKELGYIDSQKLFDNNCAQYYR